MCDQKKKSVGYFSSTETTWIVILGYRVTKSNNSPACDLPVSYPRVIQKCWTSALYCRWPGLYCKFSLLWKTPSCLIWQHIQHHWDLMTLKLYVLPNATNKTNITILYNVLMRHLMPNTTDLNNTLHVHVRRMDGNPERSKWSRIWRMYSFHDITML